MGLEGSLPMVNAVIGMTDSVGARHASPNVAAPLINDPLTRATHGSPLPARRNLGVGGMTERAVIFDGGGGGFV